MHLYMVKKRPKIHKYLTTKTHRLKSESKLLIIDTAKSKRRQLSKRREVLGLEQDMCIFFPPSCFKPMGLNVATLPAAVTKDFPSSPLFTLCVCGGVVIIFILDVRHVDATGRVTQEEFHTGFLHLPSAMLVFIFIARRIQPSLSFVDRGVEFCVPTN